MKLLNIKQQRIMMLLINHFLMTKAELRYIFEIFAIIVMLLHNIFLWIISDWWIVTPSLNGWIKRRHLLVTRRGQFWQNIIIVRIWILMMISLLCWSSCICYKLFLLMRQFRCKSNQNPAMFDMSRKAFSESFHPGSCCSTSSETSYQL